jgi:hypothetical protein
LRRFAVFACFLFLLAAQRTEATDTTAHNFSCDGKMTGPLISENKPELLHNLGLVVNLAERTVSFAGNAAPFSKVDAARYLFSR